MDLEFWSFEFVSDLVLRASNLEFGRPWISHHVQPRVPYRVNPGLIKFRQLRHGAGNIQDLIRA